MEIRSKSYSKRNKLRIWNIKTGEDKNRQSERDNERNDVWEREKERERERERERDMDSDRGEVIW